MADENSKPDYLGHRERIRQKYLQTEGRGMADYELLELLLTYVQPRKDVKPIAKDMLNKFGDFNKTVSAPISELVKIDGIKENSAILVKLIKTCALRASWENLNEKDAPVVTNWDMLADYCRSAMADLDIEEFRIIYLNAKLQIIKEEKLQTGTIDRVAVHPREIIKAAIAQNAKGMVLVHNHPSGNPKPSEQDVMLTEKIVDAAQLFEIFVFDHIVVSKNDVYSMRIHGAFDFKLPSKYEPE